MTRIDAVAVEFAWTPGRDDHRARKKYREPKRIIFSASFRRNREYAHRSRLAFLSDQKPNAGGMIEDWNIQADCFPGQHLDHEARRAGPAAGGAADFVVIGLIPEHAAELILRNRQTHELQG